MRSDEQLDGLCAGAMVDQAARARQFIYDELVATETDYIRDLKAVILVRSSAVTWLSHDTPDCHMTVT